MYCVAIFWSHSPWEACEGKLDRKEPENEEEEGAETERPPNDE